MSQMMHKDRDLALQRIGVARERKRVLGIVDKRIEALSAMDTIYTISRTGRKIRDELRAVRDQIETGDKP